MNNLKFVSAVLLFMSVACSGVNSDAVAVTGEKPVSHGQQWEYCDDTEGCFAGSGLKCHNFLCTFECSDAGKIEQCQSIVGECLQLADEQVVTCQQVIK